MILPFEHWIQQNMTINHWVEPREQAMNQIGMKQTMKINQLQTMSQYLLCNLHTKWNSTALFALLKLKINETEQLNNMYDKDSKSCW